MNRTRAPIRMAALGEMRPASQVRPTMDATINAAARSALPERHVAARYAHGP